MTTRDAADEWRPHGLGDFAEGIDLVLCDVWGVVHNGLEHHAPAVEALRRFRRQGGTVVLITNAPAPRSQVERRLDRLAVPRDAYDSVATSGDVAVALLARRGCPAVSVIAPPGETVLIEEAARVCGRPLPVVAHEAAEVSLCIGPRRDSDAPEAYDAELDRLRGRDVEMICANPDLVVHVGDQLVTCAGAIAERYDAKGGVVVQAGKPFRPIYERALALAREVRGTETPMSRILAIGDAMHTDIEGAARLGIGSLLITSGIHRAMLHPADGRVGPLALAQFLRGYEARPSAVAPVLAWQV